MWWDPHPIFYYLILHYWIKFIGTSELVLRSLSAIFGILTILLTYHIGNRFFKQKVGVLASILVLMSPLNLWYSQEARMYTLTSLLMLLSIYFFIALITARKSLLNSIFYIISSIILIYTDYIGLFVIIFQMLYVLCYLYLFKRCKINVFLWCYCIILLLYIPWLPSLYHMVSAGDVKHIPSTNLWDGLKVLVFYMVDAGIDDFQAALLPAALLPLVSYTTVEVLIGIAGLACWIMCSLGTIFSFRNRSDSGVLLTMICSIPVTMLIISQSIMRIFCSKQISGFVPEIALLIAVGYADSSDVCSKFKIKFLYRMLIMSFILVVIINGYNFYLLYHNNTKETWRDTARYVEKNLQQNDTIVLLREANGPFRYYMRGYPGIKGVKNIKELKALLKTHARCWLVYSDSNKSEFETEINQYLKDRAYDIIKRRFIGTTVIFYRML